jgi:tetratricopeptide (TPR) repeat protein
LQVQTISADPRRPPTSVSSDFEAQGDQMLFDAVASAARWVRSLSGEGIRELREQDTRPEDLTTPSWKALSLLQQARDRRDANDAQGALIFAGEALQVDPGFAAAESLRGDLLTQLREYKEAFAAHRHALELAKTRNITGRERYEIEAIYDEDGQDYGALLTNYKAWIAHFPKDYRPHFYLANLLYDRGGFESAVLQMESAKELQPADYAIYPHLATYYLGSGKIAQARNCAATLRKMGESEWALVVEGQVLLAQRRFDEALHVLRPLQDQRDDVFSAVVPLYVANLLADSGRLKEAETVTAEAATTDFRLGLSARSAERKASIAYIRYELGDFDAARAWLVAALPDLDDPNTISLVGALFARIGDLPMAERVLTLLNRWSGLPIAKNAAARVRAEIALARHSPTANDLVNAVDLRSQTPLLLDFVLHASSVLHSGEDVNRTRASITDGPVVLLKWDDRPALPGLFWRARCASSESKTLIGSPCLQRPVKHL